MIIDELDYEIAKYEENFSIIAWYMKDADEPFFKAHLRIEAPTGLIDDPIGYWRSSYEEAQLDIINYMAVQRA